MNYIRKAMKISWLPLVKYTGRTPFFVARLSHKCVKRLNNGDSDVMRDWVFSYRWNKGVYKTSYWYFVLFGMQVNLIERLSLNILAIFDNSIDKKMNALIDRHKQFQHFNNQKQLEGMFPTLRQTSDYQIIKKLEDGPILVKKINV